MNMYQEFLSRLKLHEALWWFIENSEGIEDISVKDEVFFYLRQRVRNEP